MRILMILLLLLIPSAVFAQDYRGMSEQDMQKMMEKMQGAQSCMQNVDQQELKALGQRSQQIEAELKSLCTEGKRDEAQDRAIAFGQEMAGNPAIKEMRKCSEMMEGVMHGMKPQMPFMEKDRDYSKEHFCDNY